ncbi:MAG: urease subunit beta [Myxococcaceae bacterium]|nr:MAG: urease subunit beta [Myxococcaceae bacterium]
MPTPIGGLVLASDPIEINEGRPRVTITVRNTGDRPIQVGSHFHFFEVNRALEFDRAVAFGMRLDISASTAVRFEPGDQKDVTLVPFGGKQRAYGFNGLVDSWTGPGPSHAYRPAFGRAMQLARDLGFKLSLPAAASEAPPPTITAPSPAPPKRTAPPTGPKKKGTR